MGVVANPLRDVRTEACYLSGVPSPCKTAAPKGLQCMLFPT